MVSGGSQHLTWSDLHAEARRIAAALARDGVKPQDRVVFVGKNDPPTSATCSAAPWPERCRSR